MKGPLRGSLAQFSPVCWQIVARDAPFLPPPHCVYDAEGRRQRRYHQKGRPRARTRQVRARLAWASLRRSKVSEAVALAAWLQPV